MLETVPVGYPYPLGYYKKICQPYGRGLIRAGPKVPGPAREAVRHLTHMISRLIRIP